MQQDYSDLLDGILTVSRRWEEFANQRQRLNNSPFAPEGVAGAAFIRKACEALASEVNRTNHARRMQHRAVPILTRLKAARGAKPYPRVQSCYRSDRTSHDLP